eukprot:COSAG06_NODE_91_length_24730_cov_26.482603_3_plen_163_part_00
MQRDKQTSLHGHRIGHRMAIWIALTLNSYQSAGSTQRKRISEDICFDVLHTTYVHLLAMKECQRYCGLNNEQAMLTVTCSTETPHVLSSPLLCSISCCTPPCFPAPLTRRADDEPIRYSKSRHAISISHTHQAGKLVKSTIRIRKIVAVHPSIRASVIQSSI